ncbi:cytochrome bo3 quinol oxidase subunit 2 [Paraburkholderia steynii]|uniref:Ubiquinol oxidase subunit 2 n=2 Tax=Paraburkholderia steynii TaxID=1245441 RepID=A0A7Z7B158_9BURK|nr:cytochrome bo3 quinol oxidase subunit 2 [Paraburkholderia steynii]
MRNPPTHGGSPQSAGRWFRSPPFRRQLVRAGRVAATGALSLLGGCSMVLFNPKGDIGEQEKNLILIALGLMLLVVIPVIALTLYFAWRYRASNTKAKYAPTWAHSTTIEVVVWTIPCIIVATLAVLIWKTTHSLDPYKPIESNVKPVRVEVVALNWKWLFIYPDYGVASVNQLALPVDTPVDFRLTAESLMNSFFIPQLGSQVYAMSGMQTQLHLIANSSGTYAGRSSAFSGPGFSDMNFDTVVTSRGEFDAWVARAKASPQALDVTAYDSLQQPSKKNPVTLYSNVAPGLFDGIVYQYMRDAAGRPICTTANADMYIKPARLPSHAALVSE